MNTTPIYARSNGTAAGVAGAVEISMSVPPRGVIKRVRASKVSGSATTLAIEVRETSGGTGADIVVSYAAAASIDNEESIFYSVPEVSPGLGTLYFSVTPDAWAPATNVVISRLDIEKVA
jgi:hypothetical protein|tara:strand:- start:1702 stop:2061 length:360 start_codon:yes stop_codon:yes gene_type:complete